MRCSQDLLRPERRETNSWPSNFVIAKGTQTADLNEIRKIENWRAADPLGAATDDRIRPLSLSAMNEPVPARPAINASKGDAR